MGSTGNPIYFFRWDPDKIPLGSQLFSYRGKMGSRWDRPGIPYISSAGIPVGSQIFSYREIMEFEWDPSGIPSGSHWESHIFLPLGSRRNPTWDSTGIPAGFPPRFSLGKSMGANDPWGGAIFDPRGMIGRIYIENHYTLLHTKYESFGPCGFGKEDFFFS